MKVILEIEKYDELKEVEKFFKKVHPSSIKKTIPDRIKKRKEFIEFIKKNSLKVDKVEIPGREERNAR